MASSRDGDQVAYRSRRTDRRGPKATFEGNWRPAGDWRQAAPGTLEQFLVERYSLFSVRRGKLLRGDVAHPPWQLAAADVELQTCDMARLLDLQLRGPPVSALATQPIDVEAARPSQV